MLQSFLRVAAAMLAVIVVFDTGASTSSPWQRPAVAPAASTETLRSESRALMASDSEFAHHEAAA